MHGVTPFKQAQTVYTTKSNSWNVVGVIKREKKIIVSIHCLGLLESCDSIKDIKRGMDW